MENHRVFPVHGLRYTAALAQNRCSTQERNANWVSTTRAERDGHPGEIHQEVTDEDASEGTVG